MSKSGGLDVEAEERYAEVQKGRASVADWTLKEREGIRKSKGMSKHGGLDVEAELRYAEVQRG